MIVDSFKPIPDKVWNSILVAVQALANNQSPDWIQIYRFLGINSSFHNIQHRKYEVHNLAIQWLDYYYPNWRDGDKTPYNTTRPFTNRVRRARVEVIGGKVRLALPEMQLLDQPDAVESVC